MSEMIENVFFHWYISTPLFNLVICIKYIFVFGKLVESKESKKT